MGSQTAQTRPRAAGEPSPAPRRLERARLLYLHVDSSDPARPAPRRCEFEGGRGLAGEGRSEIFSGPPPRSWGFRLPEPAPAADIEVVRREVEALVGDFRGRSRLQYLAKNFCRAAFGPDEAEPPVVRSQVWALLGNVVTPGGRVVPIGLSGRGDGLAELGRERASGQLARMIDHIDASEPLPGEPSPAVLAPPAAAVLIHEAVGHFAEAPPQGRVDVSHRIGVRIASELFDLTDDPQAPGGPAHYPADDDGMPYRGATELVRQGCMLRLLHAADSARSMGVDPTANGRAATVWNPPIPRMSNLLCAPGTASEEELLDELGHGLYLHSLAYGYGYGFRLEAQVRLAEEVKGGRRTGRYFSGGVVDESRGVLTRAVRLGAESHWNSNAMCGKEGQLLYDVGTWAPAIRMLELGLKP